MKATVDSTPVHATFAEKIMLKYFDLELAYDFVNSGEHRVT